ncbi:MAG: T9SS type A sorting domain-containing protein, partial [Bacteroidota bacterium]
TSAQGCISTNTAIANITVNITPTISVNSGAICAGDAFTILPSGASTYTYSGGIAIVSPTGNMAYTITGTSSEGCISTNMAISNLTVHPLPIISANSGSICSGDSFTINASGALSYTYSGGSDIVNPNTTSSYSISGTSADGCISSAPAVIAITVHASPTISINNGVICSGESFTLNPSGALTYTYSSGNSVVSPMTNTSFNIIGTSAQGCISTNTAIANITVNITPTISVNSGSICSGNNFILIPSGAVSYTYSGGSATVSPMNDDSYTITGTSAEGCINNNVAVANVTVHLTPTISVNSGSICSGNSFTLIPSGALTYTFSSGNSIVNPMTDNAYNVIGTSAQGCIGSNTAISNVSVYPSPTITSISGTICSGNSFNIVASGANTYTYSGGSTLVSPMSTTAYSITGTSALGCISAAPAVCDVTVHQTPTVSVNSGSICSGDSFTIIASGASSYTYSGGTTVVNPMTNAAFNVIGISAQGCISSNTAIANVTVNITPTVSVNSGSICSGESFTMVPAGANTYTFSSGVEIVSPIVNDNYFVLGTSAQGCISSNTAVSNVTVHPTPTITTISGSICSGNSFNLNAGGAFTYSYSSGNSIVTPNSSSTYSIIGTSLMGCTSASPAISNVTVFTTPTVSANSALICEGDSYTINPSGALTYTFSSGSAVVSPSISTGYTITGSSIDNCISANAAIITVSVQPAISLSITGTPTVCIGAPVTIYAAGATSFTWNLGANSANITVVPIANTTYSVYGEYGVCHNSAAYTISVIARPIVNATISNSVICIGNSVIANASGANNYVWSGNISNGIAFSPSVSASYSVVGTSTLTGCSSSNQAVVNILVNPLPILNVSSSRNLMCVGESVSLTAGGANTYVWNTGSTNNNIVVSPTLSTTYTLTGTDINSCQNKVVYTQSVSACNGLDKLSGNGIKMNVFPNPNNGEFYIVSDQDLNIIITNELGQHILSAQLNENNQHQVQINKLSNGIYFIIGTNNHNNVKQKVIITQ